MNNRKHAMKEKFSVPKKFAEYPKTLFEKDEISQREFVDLCLVATNLVDSNWEKRQGMAYYIVGAWLNFENIGQDDLLNQIGSSFSILELPDHHVASSEEEVRDKWRNVAELVKEADEKFT